VPGGRDQVGHDDDVAALALGLPEPALAEPLAGVGADHQQVDRPVRRGLAQAGHVHRADLPEPEGGVAPAADQPQQPQHDRAARAAAIRRRRYTLADTFRGGGLRAGWGRRRWTVRWTRSVIATPCRSRVSGRCSRNRPVAEFTGKWRKSWEVGGIRLFRARWGVGRGATAGRAAARRRRSIATAAMGNTSTDRTPAPTRAAAFSRSMVPLRSPISARATSRGRAVAVRNMVSTRWAAGRSLRYRNRDGTPRTASSSTKKMSSRSGASAMERTSRVMPEATKNSGMKKP